MTQMQMDKDIKIGPTEVWSKKLNSNQVDEGKSCEYGKETLVSAKCGSIVDGLSKRPVLSKDTVAKR